MQAEMVYDFVMSLPKANYDEDGLSVQQRLWH